MAEEQKPIRLREKDCLIDWAHHSAEDENGNPIEEDWTELREEWLHEDCDCNEHSLANRKKCYRYFTYDYDDDMYKKWMRQYGYDEFQISYWGLEKMFNDEWIKSPAFVDWKDFRVFHSLLQIESFVESINDCGMRVAILTYFIDNAEYLLGKTTKREISPALKNLRTRYKEAAKIRKEEEALKKAAERKKSPKEKPEFVLSLDEIIEYVKTKSPESAPAIRSMLYYMLLHKDGWNKPSTLSKIDSMDVKIVHQGDNVYGDKTVGNQIGLVGTNGIGVQEVHE